MFNVGVLVCHGVLYSRLYINCKDFINFKKINNQLQDVTRKKRYISCHMTKFPCTFLIVDIHNKQHNVPHFIIKVGVNYCEQNCVLMKQLKRKIIKYLCTDKTYTSETLFSFTNENIKNVHILTQI